MRSTSTVYVDSAAQHEQLKARLKLCPCPHCRAIGFLICHGYLRGYGDAADQLVLRGWRVFCSNRGNKSGCGATYAILLAQYLYGRLVDAGRVWRFFNALLDGVNLKQAWERVASPFGLENAYKLWKSFRRNQSHLRIRLFSVVKPANSAPCPLLETIADLKTVFAGEACPVAAFQNRFQTAFLLP